MIDNNSEVTKISFKINLNMFTNNYIVVFAIRVEFNNLQRNVCLELPASRVLRF